MTDRETVTIQIHTRVPEKYLLVDRETGDVWKSDGVKWTQAKDIERKFDFETITIKASAMRPIRNEETIKELLNRGK